jgi:poly(A) polymerase
MDDIEARRLRLIGDPETRYKEDPVRMLRAARFAAKLGFELDSSCAEPIAELGGMLRDIPPARLFEEVLKLFQTGHAAASLEQLWHYDLLQHLFPAADRRLHAEDSYTAALIINALDNTDARINGGQSVTPAFLFAVFLWPDVAERAAALEADGEPPIPAVQMAADEVLAEQLKYTSLPKRFSLPMREIWTLQPRLEQFTGQRALRTLAHPRFRAGYDFLCLRVEAGEQKLAERAQWWTDIQQREEEDQVEMVRRAGSSQRNRRRRGGASRRRGPAAEGG